jgi:hypothetical protein
MATRKTAVKRRPTSITLRSYDVGFGDGYLLSFHYPRFDRHLLIDFGSTRLPQGKTVKKNYMTQVALQIAQDCGGKLHAVVATHRHKDHISGFTPNSAGNGPGDIIRSLNPNLVIQPWTEDPEAERDARKPTSRLGTNRLRAAQHAKMLGDMNAFAGHVKSAAGKLRGNHLKAAREQLEFLGDDNELRNRAAVENLMTMGRGRYVYFGAKSGLESLLPGVSTRVLGPPTLDQDARIEKQRSRDPQEFWHLQASRQSFWAKRGQLAQLDGETPEPLFPGYPVSRPAWDMRWYRYQAQQEHAENLLSIVRIVDKAMNNTSVILLFEVGDKSLLFPGDAQYENWMHALGHPDIVERLARVNVYKVGHHGSLNATPKSLWETFEKKGGARSRDRLMSFLSTKDHVHGHAEDKTEVPRDTLVDALSKQSDLHDTRRVADDVLCITTSMQIDWS